MHDRGCILFFVKYPRAGAVKKRLAAELGAETAARLYACFVEDVVQTLDRSGCHVLICFHPAGARDKMIDWLGPRYQYLPQRGGDLGQRMKRGFFDAFTLGFQYTIGIGSDIPDLPADFIQVARTALKKHDAVLGPARDGGYYMIGFRRDAFVPEAFDGPRWGSDTVFAETMGILGNKKRSLYTLPPWNDIDTSADLKEFYKRNGSAIQRCSRTIAYSIDQGLVKSVYDEINRCSSVDDLMQLQTGKLRAVRS